MLLQIQQCGLLFMLLYTPGADQSILAGGTGANRAGRHGGFARSAEFKEPPPNPSLASAALPLWTLQVGVNCIR